VRQLRGMQAQGSGAFTTLDGSVRPGASLQAGAHLTQVHCNSQSSPHRAHAHVDAAGGNAAPTCHHAGGVKAHGVRDGPALGKGAGVREGRVRKVQQVLHQQAVLHRHINLRTRGRGVCICVCACVCMCVCARMHMHNGYNVVGTSAWNGEMGVEYMCQPALCPERPLHQGKRALSASTLSHQRGVCFVMLCALPSKPGTLFQTTYSLCRLEQVPGL